MRFSPQAVESMRVPAIFLNRNAEEHSRQLYKNEKLREVEYNSEQKVVNEVKFQPKEGRWRKIKSEAIMHNKFSQ